ncbi:uncharacterized protein BO80DRAFT_465560 [Aspergillus ibericus CBS 121593]|uniref:Uncharacterized protein n=1 Tax=Aspergillus ibericus CBS 121593 TaxID=1448316 RepID=A0A395GX14_9EURO|nr:hypothetical protein BO80DRAFT_465560 [Aspergillus ibericus CBS 121593]RAL00132.1 hypothetical protein BO80DRAFT_465560 [Aspergillus ibericus CBS 121593]
MPRKVAKTAKKANEPLPAEPTAVSGDRPRRTAAKAKTPKKPTSAERIRLLEETIADLEKDNRTLRGKKQALKDANPAEDSNQLLKATIKKFNEYHAIVGKVFYRYVEDNQFATDQLAMDNALGSSSLEWADLFPYNWSKEIRCACGLFKEWVMNHARQEPQDLSREQKTDLIRRLDGYCVQEDMDYIYSSLPRSLQGRLLPQLVATYFIKDCVDRFFTNPFWWIVPQPGIQKGDAKPQDAHLWRLWTTRFAHPWAGFGSEMVSHRISTVNSICADALKQDFLQSLLRDSDPSVISSRDDWLQRIYHHFAEISVKMAAHLSYVQLGTLHDIDPYFRRSSDNTEASYGHGKVDKLDGHRVLVLEQPAVYIRGGWEDPNGSVIQKKAVVYVEERDDSSK